MKKWTSEEIVALKTSADNGLTIKEISETLSRTVGSVVGKLHDLNINYVKMTKSIGEETLKRADLFLLEYEARRIVKRAVRHSGLYEGAIERLLTIPDFKLKFDSIQKHIFETIQCSVCKKIFSSSDASQFHSITESAKFGTCKNCEKNRKRKRKQTLQGRLISLLAGVRHRDSKAEIDLDFCLELWSKQEGRCYYTGDELHFNVNSNRQKNMISIDRIDSSKGYLKSNTVLTTWEVNSAKNNTHHTDFLNMCSKISRIHGKNL